VTSDFEIGVLPWGDRTATVKSVDSVDAGAPDFLGKEWIQTSAASKNYNPDSGTLAQATITLNGTVNVYLVVDHRAIAAGHPDMTGWTNTGFHMIILEGANNRTFDIYVKLAQTGNVDLPIQNYNGAFNYFVILE
jgi:hypothetical protein